jgi:hypothetical protein
MNEKQALDLLIKIATKQQQIIEKLAQTTNSISDEDRPWYLPKPPETDPVVVYLMKYIPVAAANAGISGVMVTNVDITNNYVAHVKGIPPKLGGLFRKVWDKQLATQKPELVGRVSLILE